MIPWKDLLSICLSIIAIPVYSQIGLQVFGSNHLFNPETGTRALQTEALKDVNFGLSYAIQFKKVRIELHPGLSVGYGGGEFLNSDLNFNQFTAKVLLPMTIYPFDLSSDCNCPTFNKQGEVFEKGLHFIVQPGIGHAWRTVDELDKPENSKTSEAEIGLGIGFDFGLNRHSTLNFYALLAQHLNGKYSISEDQKSWIKSSSHLSFQLGLRYLWYSKRRR
ncbi:MAG: hypothetical protein IPM34_08700 [Saprospiraceae bacterium]|nr:hypothetical protein [Saprospiraceae bacterium]